LLVLSVFAEFDFVSPKYVSRDYFEALWNVEKWPKMRQHGLTVASNACQEDQGRSNEKKARGEEPATTTAKPWWNPALCWPP